MGHGKSNHAPTGGKQNVAYASEDASEPGTKATRKECHLKELQVANVALFNQGSMGKRLTATGTPSTSEADGKNEGNAQETYDACASLLDEPLPFNSGNSFIREFPY